MRRHIPRRTRTRLILNRHTAARAPWRSAPSSRDSYSSQLTVYQNEFHIGARSESARRFPHRHAAGRWHSRGRLGISVVSALFYRESAPTPLTNLGGRRGMANLWAKKQRLQSGLRRRVGARWRHLSSCGDRQSPAEKLTFEACLLMIPSPRRISPPARAAIPINRRMMYPPRSRASRRRNRSTRIKAVLDTLATTTNLALKDHRRRTRFSNRSPTALRWCIAFTRANEID